MLELLLNLVLFNTIVVIKEDNTSTTCIVVEKPTNQRFSADKFGEVEKPTKEIICN